jgi:hypothetical protein
MGRDEGLVGGEGYWPGVGREAYKTPGISWIPTMRKANCFMAIPAGQTARMPLGMRPRICGCELDVLVRSKVQ